MSGTRGFCQFYYMRLCYTLEFWGFTSDWHPLFQIPNSSPGIFLSFFKLKLRFLLWIQTTYYLQRSRNLIAYQLVGFLSPCLLLCENLDSLVLSNLHFLPNFLSGRNLMLNKDEQPSEDRLTLAPSQNLCTTIIYTVDPNVEKSD